MSQVDSDLASNIRPETRGAQPSPTADAHSNDRKSNASFLLPDTEFVLASASPRRAEIMRAVDWSFTVRVADIDESLRAGESPFEYVERLAHEKAASIANIITDTLQVEKPGDAQDDFSSRRRLIIGADTVVVINAQVLGKPNDKQHARRMLQALSGREHQVITGVAVIEENSNRRRIAHERTQVRFANLSDAEIEAYVETGEPHDKAGAYAVQGRAALFIENITGDYWNVVGLPVKLVYRLACELRKSK